MTPKQTVKNLDKKYLDLKYERLSYKRYYAIWKNTGALICEIEPMTRQQIVKNLERYVKQKISQVEHENNFCRLP